MTEEEYSNASELEKILYDKTGMLAKNHPSIVEAMEDYAEAKAGQVDAVVMRSGYLGVIDNQKVFVVAEDEDKAVNELYKASGDEEFDLLDLGRISIIVSA